MGGWVVDIVHITFKSQFELSSIEGSNLYLGLQEVSLWVAQKWPFLTKYRFWESYDNVRTQNKACLGRYFLQTLQILIKFGGLGSDFYVAPNLKLQIWNVPSNYTEFLGLIVKS